MYERAGSDDDPDPFCNPVLPGADLSRLPEPEMLFRCVMPLAWSIRGRWVYPEMKRVMDDFIASFPPAQVKIVWQVLNFLLDLFPGDPDDSAPADVRAYWRGLAEEPERYHAETPSEKSILLQVLLEAAQDHKIIPKD